VELPLNQPPAVAFTPFADAWPRAMEIEIGAAQYATGAKRKFDFDMTIHRVLAPIYQQPPPLNSCFFRKNVNPYPYYPVYYSVPE